MPYPGWWTHLHPYIQWKTSCYLYIPISLKHTSKQCPHTYFYSTKHWHSRGSRFWLMLPPDADYMLCCCAYDMIWQVPHVNQTGLAVKVLNPEGCVWNMFVWIKLPKSPRLINPDGWVWNQSRFWPCQNIMAQNRQVATENGERRKFSETFHSPFLERTEAPDTPIP